MAEAIGVVAAVLEFGKVLLELKHFYSSIRDAPETLSDLLEELELTESILQTLADQDGMMSAYAPPDVVKRCRQSCEKALGTLHQVCSQLLKCLKQSKWRGSIRSVLKEDLLEKAGQRVERAKVNLLLAQNTASK